MSSLIINNIDQIENYSYLELGVNDNINFYQIKCKDKFSVDMNGQAMFTGTTDKFFEEFSKNKKFDIIFIDANHNYDYVLRDFNNSIDHASKWILIHDMIPPSVKFTRPELCSDSFKILYYMLTETNFNIYPMNNNFGLTLVKLPAHKIFPPDKCRNITYNEFVNFIKTKKTYSDQEIIKILRKENV
jgi:hypothetical protein